MLTTPTPQRSMYISHFGHQHSLWQAPTVFHYYLTPCNQQLGLRDLQKDTGVGCGGSMGMGWSLSPHTNTGCSQAVWKGSGLEQSRQPP